MILRNMKISTIVINIEFNISIFTKNIYFIEALLNRLFLIIICRYFDEDVG